MTDQNKLPILTGDELRLALREYDRSPFIDVLYDWISSAPSGAAIKVMAERNPSLWANAIVGLAKMAGFSEKKEIEHSGKIDLRNVSDAQLEYMLLEKAQRLGLPLPDKRAAVDLEPQQSADDEDNG